MEKEKWMPSKRFLTIAGFGFVLFVFGILILCSTDCLQANPLVIITSAINIALFFYQLLLAVKSRPFSFNMMFWLFNLFFFGFAPLLQHFANHYAWHLIPTNSEIVYTNILVFLWSLCYILGNQFKLLFLSKLSDRIIPFIKRNFTKMVAFLRNKLVNPIGKYLQNKKPVLRLIKTDKPWLKQLNKRIHKCWRDFQRKNFKDRYFCVLLAISIFLTFFDLVTVGIRGQFTRSTSGMEISSTAISLLLHHGLSNTILFIASIHIFRAKERKSIDKGTIIAAACLLIACFPTGLARNMMASFYAGLLIILFDRTRKGRWFSFVILGGLILVFPAIEVFRHAATLRDKNLLQIILQSLRTTYLGGHYDAHQNFISVQRYVEKFGLTWGEQLVSVLLFFVPRSIWPNKPIGTGHLAITMLNQNDFTNVAAPLVSEAFVNFGAVGIVIFGWLLGFAVCRIDRAYWRRRKNWNLLDLLYPHVMFMFFVMLRGDLLSSYSYTVAQCFVGIIIYGLYRFYESLDTVDYSTLQSNSGDLL